MSLSSDLDSIDDRDLFFHVLKNAISNVFWYGAAVVVILVLGKAVWWWLGAVLFGLFALIMIIATLQTVFHVVLGVISIPLSIYERAKGRSARAREQLWLGAAQVVQIAELIVLGNYLFWLARALFWT